MRCGDAPTRSQSCDAEPVDAREQQHGERRPEDGPILHARCEVFQGPNVDDLSLRRARYSCNAVTPQTAESSIGDLFVGEIDFATGRIRFHRRGIPIWLGI